MSFSVSNMKDWFRRTRDAWIVSSVVGVIIMAITLSAAQIGHGVGVIFDQVTAFWVELAFVGLIVAVVTLTWLLWKQRHSISELEENLEVTKADLKDASEEIAHLTEKLARTQRESRSSVASFVQAQASLEKERERTKRLESENNVLQGGLQSTKGELKGAKVEIQRLRGQIAQLNTRKGVDGRRRAPPPTSPSATGMTSPAAAPARRTSHQGKGGADLRGIALERRRLGLHLVTFGDRNAGRTPTPMKLTDAKSLHSHLFRFHRGLGGDPSGVFTIPNMSGQPGRGETVDLTSDQALFLLNEINGWIKSTEAG